MRKLSIVALNSVMAGSPDRVGEPACVPELLRVGDRVVDPVENALFLRRVEPGSGLGHRLAAGGGRGNLGVDEALLRHSLVDPLVAPHAAGLIVRCTLAGFVDELASVLHRLGGEN